MKKNENVDRFTGDSFAGRGFTVSGLTVHHGLSLYGSSLYGLFMSILQEAGLIRSTFCKAFTIIETPNHAIRYHQVPQDFSSAARIS